MTEDRISMTIKDRLVESNYQKIGMIKNDLRSLTNILSVYIDDSYLANEFLSDTFDNIEMLEGMLNDGDFIAAYYLSVELNRRLDNIRQTFMFLISNSHQRAIQNLIQQIKITLFYIVENTPKEYNDYLIKNRDDDSNKRLDFDRKELAMLIAEIVATLAV